MSHFVQYFFLGLGLINGLIAFYVWRQKPRHPVHWTFALFVSGAVCWSAGLALLSLTSQYWLDKTILYGGLLTAGGFLLFAHVFPDKDRLPRRAWWPIAPLMVAAILIPFNLVIEKSIVHADGSLEPTNGPAFVYFAAALCFCVGYGFVIFIRRYKNSQALTRLQMQYLFLGLGFLFGSALVFDVILPAFGIFRFNLLGPAGSVVMVLTLAYSIIRHDLMEISAVIQRGVMYTLIFGAVLATYLSGVSLLTRLLGRATDAAVLSGGVTTLVSVLVFPKVSEWFKRLTDPIFFRHEYDYAESLQRLGKILSEGVFLNEIISKLSVAMRQILKTGKFEFCFTEILPENGRGLSKIAFVCDSPPLIKSRFSQFAVVIPLFLAQRLIGAVFLGPKLSGQAYTHRDFVLLDVFSYQAAVAFEKARLFRQVERHSQELEQRVQERTQQIRQLQQVQENLLIHIAHSLQTPLTVVKSELDFLKRQHLQPETAQRFERSLDEISKFIYSLLKLTRLETGQQKNQNHPVDFSELVDDILEYVNILCQERGIEIQAQVQRGIMVRGVKEDLNDLITNLISNAIKYIANSRQIRVKLKLQDQQATLTVTDTGVGISPEDLPRVFDEFYRGRIAPVEDLASTGLGLAICKRIVENHDGRIEISSVLNQGTEVKVALPKA